MSEEYQVPFGSHQQPECLVIHCSDGRFQPHFRGFLSDHLGAEEYALIAVPGGCHFLTLLDYLPKFSWVGWRWVKFLVDVAKPTRVILIGHDDCLWYKDFRFALDKRDPREKTISDLRGIKKGVEDRFQLKSEAYFARLDGARVVFEAV